MSNTILETSKQIKAKLNNLYASSEIDSFIFMMYTEVLSISTAQVLAYPEKEINLEQLTIIDNWVERLQKNEPIQYIIGHCEFYDCQLVVREGVLIPRPETEELVYWILNDFGQGAINILDIGTGSGAIPIALAKNRKAWKVQAIDVSPSALTIANENALMNELDISFHQLDILKNDMLDEVNFDVIVSNPPYVTQTEKNLMRKNVLDYEPHLALFVEDDSPLVFYIRIAQLAKRNLNKGGCLYFEINEQFGDETCQMLKKIGYESIEVRKDLNGKDRMIKAINV